LIAVFAALCDEASGKRLKISKLLGLGVRLKQSVRDLLKPEL